MRDSLNRLDSSAESMKNNPIQNVVRNLKPQKIKRFYKVVSISEERTGYWVRLDGKPIRSPQKKIIECNNLTLANKLLEEWESQVEYIDYVNMPITRILNVAFDRVSENHISVVETVGSYATSDLLCYRANGPEKLVIRQHEYWDPILEWGQQTFKLNFNVTDSILPVEQPESTILKIKEVLREYNPIQLTAIHTVTTICSSVLLALALEKEAFERETIWNATNVDEDWNIEHWGEDEELMLSRKIKRQDFIAASQIFDSYNRSK